MEGGRNDMTHQEGMRYMIHACFIEIQFRGNAWNKSSNTEWVVLKRTFI